MPLCHPLRLRLTGLLLGPALYLLTPGASAILPAQQIPARQTPAALSSSSSSVQSASLTIPTSPADAALPDDPSASLDPDPRQASISGQTTIPRPVIHTDNPDAVSPNGTQQTKRILGIMPNFRSVSADVRLPPMNAKEKFLIAGRDTFDYSSFFIAGIQAGFAMDSNSYPEFHQGVAGYTRYYWHTLADTTSENFFVGGLGPIVFRQDNRFYTRGHGGFRKRTYYALSRVLISRTDNGDPTFNYAEIIGSGASSGLSTLWYPTRYRTWTKVGQKWLTSDIIDGANFMLKEFWPDINKYLFHTH